MDLSQIGTLLQVAVDATARRRVGEHGHVVQRDARESASEAYFAFRRNCIGTTN
jgi:hypothetical protein